MHRRGNNKSMVLVLHMVDIPKDPEISTELGDRDLHRDPNRSRSDT